MKQNYRITKRGWIVFSTIGILVFLAAAYGILQWLQGTPVAPESTSSQVEQNVEVDTSEEQLSQVEEEETGSPSHSPGERSQATDEKQDLEVDASSDEEQVLKDAAIAIYFEPDQYRLQESSVNDLELFIEIAKEYPSEQIVIAGNQNSDGSAAEQDKMYGEDLSKIRAERVAQYLIENGIDKIRITIIDNGSTKPLNKSNNPEEMRLNRRADIYFLKYKPMFELDTLK